MKKLILLFMLCIIVLVNTIPVFASIQSNAVNVTDIRLIVNGKNLSLERDPVVIKGRMVAPARSTFNNIDAKIDWYPKQERVDIIKGKDTISMKIGSIYANVNNVRKKMDTAPILLKGTVMVPVRFVAETFNYPIKWDGKNRVIQIGASSPNASASRAGNSTNTSRENKKTFKVVIDPGHGGYEPGAIYGGIKEKDLNLDISKRLYKLLKEQGIKVYMTRTRDSYLSLYSRTDYANKLNADLFVSIHNNAGSSRYSGSMTLYHPYTGTSRGGLTSRDLASIVQKELTNELNTNNLGIISRPKLAVLRTAKMPAVIAEIGYMTNKAELKKLKSSLFRQKSAEALKDAIIKALDSL